MTVALLFLVLAIMCGVFWTVGWGMGLGYSFDKGYVSGFLYLFIPFYAPIFLLMQRNELPLDSTRTACRFYFGGLASSIVVTLILISVIMLRGLPSFF